MSVGGVKVLDNIKLEGIQIPKTVCVGVCAGTGGGKTNHMCVNKLKLKSQDDDLPSPTKTKWTSQDQDLLLDLKCV